VTAKEIMTTEVVTISGSASVAEAVKLMKTKNVRALIVERRNPQDAYGIITQRDIAYKVVAEGRNPSSVAVHEIQSKPLIVVNPDLDVKYVARLLAKTGLSRAPVIYEQELQGIVSISDIISKAL